MEEKKDVSAPSLVTVASIPAVAKRMVSNGERITPPLWSVRIRFTAISLVANPGPLQGQ